MTRMAERLQKVMAHAGIDSRRKCEEIIRQGRVRVNGETVSRPGRKVDPGRDRITVDGREIHREERTYIMLNKPPGYITTVDDPRGRPTVMDLVSVGKRIYPVGRLDRDTRGLLLLTNDGGLAQIITHPRYEVVKEYRVRIQGRPGKRELEALESGIELEDGLTAPAGVKMLSSGERSELIIRIHEGKKRQIRRMFAALGRPLTDLQRVAVGPLRLGGLEEGQYRSLTPEEIESLEEVRRKPGAGSKTVN